MFELLKWVLVGIWLVAAAGTAGHALLNKRDPRAALGWIVVSVTIPLAGPLLYFVFGINRIRTRAKTLPRFRGHSIDGGRCRAGINKISFKWS